MHDITYFVGVDVQVRRGAAIFIMDKHSHFVDSFWLNENEKDSLVHKLFAVTEEAGQKMAIGIDAPRMPLQAKRYKQWDKDKGVWTTCSNGLNGRECEVMINAYKLANSQWTKTLSESPAWMRFGFSIFEQLSTFKYVYEVFPSASYTQLESVDVRLEFSMKNLKRGVKDMADAATAALTVREFLNGNGDEVGGGDGLGTIILPRKILR